MKIIILGAGQVGTTLAEHLAAEHNDITIIDTDGERLRTLQERMDILTVTGHGAHPNTLFRCGAEHADIIIAVTSSDETNLVACQIAYTLFHTRTKIARVRSMQYLLHEKLFDAATAFPIDVLISPEQLVTDYIRRLIDYPNALQVLDFADQKVLLISVKTHEFSGPFVGANIKNLSDLLPDVEFRIVGIFRKGIPIIPDGSTMIEPEDEVLFLSTPENVRTVMSAFIRVSEPNQRIMIAGGGNIGSRLAVSLDQDYQVKVIERNKDRVEVLATELNHGIVLLGDAADKELLLSENIMDMDVFCGLTNHDEANIMSATLAKHLGARKVMALVNRPSYLDVVEESVIDIAISPQEITIGSLLTYVRQGNIVNVHSLRRGGSEAIEVIVDGDAETSKVVGRTLQDLPMPSETTIGAIVRNQDVIMAHHDVVLEPNDRVIIFLADKRKIRQIETLFQKEE